MGLLGPVMGLLYLLLPSYNFDVINRMIPLAESCDPFSFTYKGFILFLIFFSFYSMF